jgi:hypothetical protein
MRVIYRKERRAVRERRLFDAIAAGPFGVLAPGRRHPICQPICRPLPATWRQIAIYAAPGGAKSEQVVGKTFACPIVTQSLVVRTKVPTQCHFGGAQNVTLNRPRILRAAC